MVRDKANHVIQDFQTPVFDERDGHLLEWSGTRTIANQTKIGVVLGHFGEALYLYYGI